MLLTLLRPKEKDWAYLPRRAVQAAGSLFGAETFFTVFALKATRFFGSRQQASTPHFIPLLNISAIFRSHPLQANALAQRYQGMKVEHTIRDKQNSRSNGRQTKPSRGFQRKHFSTTSSECASGDRH